MVLLGAGNHLFKVMKIPKKHREIYKAKSDIILKTMSLLHYLAINIGEYDLGFGISYLKKKKKELDLPFISANLVDQAGDLYFPPSKLVTISGVKLGVIGIMRARIKKKRIPGGELLNVLDPVKIVKRVATKLKKEGARVVIVLTDMGDMRSRILTKKELPIDVIISSCRRNRLSLPAIQNGKIILHLNRYGENVGCLTVRKLTKKASGMKTVTGGATAIFRGFFYKNTVIPLGHLVKDDASISKMVDAFAKKYPYAR